MLWHRLQPRVPTDERRDLYLDREHVTLLSGFEDRTRLETWADVSADPARDPDNPDRDDIALLAPRTGGLRWALASDRPGRLLLGVARLASGPAADDAPCTLVVSGGDASASVALPPAPADPGLTPGRLREGPAARLELPLPHGAAGLAFELQGAAGYAVLLSPHVIMAPQPVRVADLRVDAPRVSRLLPKISASGAPRPFAMRRCEPSIDAEAEPARAQTAAEAAPRVAVDLPEIEPVAAFTGPVRDARTAVAFTGSASLALTVDIPAGASLRGALALDNRLPRGSRATLAVSVDGAPVGSLAAEGLAWNEFDVPLGAHAGTGRRLQLAVTDASVPTGVVPVQEPDYAQGRKVLALYEASAVRVGVADPRLVVEREVPGHAASAQRPSVVLLQVETLRADALVPWAGTDGVSFGAPEDVAPNLAALARRSTVWRRAFAPAPWTVPSTISLLTGLPPSAHGSTTNERIAVPGDVATLAERASEDGVATGAVVASDLLSESAGYARGFASFAHVPYANARQVDDLAEAFLVDHSQQQFLLFLHEFDPHSPYAAPEPFRDRYVPAALREQTVAAVEQRLLGKLRAGVAGKAPPPTADDPDVQWLRGRYLGEIAWWDSQLERLLDALKRLEIDDTTLVVIVADHGEEFLEHGLYGHGSDLFDETLHVPLLVAAPPAHESLLGAAPPGDWSATLPVGGRDEIVETEALHASVLEWLGVTFDANAVRPPLRRPSGFAFSETDKGLVLDGGGDVFRRPLDSVRAEGLRATIRWPVGGEHAEPVHEAFDLRGDPGAHLLLPPGDARAAGAFGLLADIVAWCDAHRAAAAPAGTSTQVFDLLRSLGYLGVRGQPTPPKAPADRPPPPDTPR